MKWTFEQKLAWAKAYLAGEPVPIPVGFTGSLKRWHNQVLKWAHVLSEYGEEGLNPSRHARTFSPDFRLTAVMRVLSGESSRSVAYSIGMPNNTCVLTWVRAYREKGVDGLKSRPKGRKKHAQEESEVPGAGRTGEAQAGELHADPRERLLKKLRALVESEERSQGRSTKPSSRQKGNSKKRG